MSDPELTAIGPTTVRLVRDAPDDTVLSVSEVFLSVFEGPNVGTEIPMGSGTIRIGSSHENELALKDASVSRHHAELTPQGSQFALRDLGSTNGTFLGDVQIREVLVQPECFVRVGKTTLRLFLKTREVSIPIANEESFGLLVGRSVAMRRIFGLLKWVAPTEATVLITGPTGTGKEMVARSVHAASPRAPNPFVVLDCGALDRDLISAELFGHEAGAFTGAVARRAGVFEQARGGTVFIDEVGELPLDLQPKLLRALEAREVRRLGAAAPTPIDVRVIAATNRDIEQMVARREFREDLYFRLCHVSVQLPPLDQRREDLPLMVQKFLERLAGQTPARSVAPEALALLSQRSWPGNARQLFHVIERAALLARGSSITAEEIMLFSKDPGATLSGSSRARAEAAASPAGAGKPLAEVEKKMILAALQDHDYNLCRTARALGIVLNTLKNKMKRYGIPREKPTGS